MKQEFKKLDVDELLLEIENLKWKRLLIDIKIEKQSSAELLKEWWNIHDRIYNLVGLINTLEK